MLPPDRTYRQASLDALRAVAALAGALHHWPYLSGPQRAAALSQVIVATCRLDRAERDSAIARTLADLAG